MTRTAGSAAARSSPSSATSRPPTWPCSRRRIEADLDDREFFVTKAIGWALREYAYTDAAWVRAFVDAHTDRIAPLCRREALKHLA